MCMWGGLVPVIYHFNQWANLLHWQRFQITELSSPLQPFNTFLSSLTHLSSFFTFCANHCAFISALFLSSSPPGIVMGFVFCAVLWQHSSTQHVAHKITNRNTHMQDPRAAWKPSKINLIPLGSVAFAHIQYLVTHGLTQEHMLTHSSWWPPSVTERDLTCATCTHFCISVTV